MALYPVLGDLADIVIAYLFPRDADATECPGHCHAHTVWNRQRTARCRPPMVRSLPTASL